jgi:hypothetical protein
MLSILISFYIIMVESRANSLFFKYYTAMSNVPIYNSNSDGIAIVCN